jgi:cysteine desulfurase
MHEKYFDCAATTPVDPRVAEEMLPYFQLHPGNPSSIHQYGKTARAAVEKSRALIAELIGAEDPYQITFTSGATEGNNWVLSRFLGKSVSLGSGEHSSIRRFVASHRMTQVESHPDLLIQMLVNNETGEIFDPVSEKEKRFAKALLVDATQGMGKIPFSVSGIDFVTGSGHKIYGPKGVGFLYQEDPILDPMIFGGDQEFGRRSGTENVPLIVGFGKAAELAMVEREQNYKHVAGLREILIDAIQSVPEARINEFESQSPYILSLSIRGIEGESLLLDLDREGYCCSAGSACSSGKVELSPVLLQKGYDPAWIRGTIRVSFGKYNSRESSEHLGNLIVKLVDSLKN